MLIVIKSVLLLLLIIFSLKALQAIQLLLFLWVQIHFRMVQIVFQDSSNFQDRGKKVSLELWSNLLIGPPECNQSTMSRRL